MTYLRIALLGTLVCAPSGAGGETRGTEENHQGARVRVAEQAAEGVARQPDRRSGRSELPESGSRRAGPPRRSTEEEGLIDAVWRVGLNEGCLLNLRDCALVWQVVEGWSEPRLPRLRRHSSRVLGLKPCTTGNCRWSRDLSRDASVPAALASGQAAWWRVVAAPRARAALAYVRKLVRGEIVDRPCPITPFTWGGPGDVQHAARNGLFPIGCEGTLNDGFAPLSAWVGVPEMAVPW